MFEFISKLSLQRGLCIALMIFGLFLAPYFFIYEFARFAFTQYSFIQIVLLSFAISAPIALIHFAFHSVCILLMNNIIINVEYTIDKWFVVMAISSLTTGVAFYATSWFYYFDDTRIATKIAANKLIYLSILSLLFSLLTYSIIITKELFTKYREQKLHKID